MAAQALALLDTGNLLGLPLVTVASEIGRLRFISVRPKS